jgi:hypothetical protein
MCHWNPQTWGPLEQKLPAVWGEDLSVGPGQRPALLGWWKGGCLYRLPCGRGRSAVSSLQIPGASILYFFSKHSRHHSKQNDMQDWCSRLPMPSFLVAHCARSDGKMEESVYAWIQANNIAEWAFSRPFQITSPTRKMLNRRPGPD